MSLPLKICSKKKKEITSIDISAKFPWGNNIFISINCDMQKVYKNQT